MEEERVQEKMKSKANSKSDRLVYNARKTRLAEIFDRLDSDNDGEVSAAKIDVMPLGDELYRAFKPLLNELDVLQQPLDKDEFVDASMRLYDVSKFFPDNFYRHFRNMKRTLSLSLSSQLNTRTTL